MKAFIKAFSISLVIMLTPMITALAVFYQRDAKPSPPVIRQGEQIAPLTLLAAVFDDKSAIATFCLMKIDGAKQQIVISLLPRELLVEESGEFTTLAQVWNKYKGERTAQALCNVLDISIDRYLELRHKDFISMYNSIGAADFTLEKTLADNNGNTLLVSGRQLIDARRAFEVLRAGQLETTADILCNLLEQHLAKLSEKQVETLFNTAVNSGKNNMSFADLESRKTKLWKNEKPEIAVVPIVGQKNPSDESFLMSADSVQKLRDRLQNENNT